jgi:hypothetical protein
MARLIRVSLAGMHFNYSGAASAFALLAINSHFSRCGSVDRISRRHSALAVRFQSQALTIGGSVRKIKTYLFVVFV